jgi:hypothetical protein
MERWHLSDLTGTSPLGLRIFYAVAADWSALGAVVLWFLLIYIADGHCLSIRRYKDAAAYLESRTNQIDAQPGLACLSGLAQLSALIGTLNYMGNIAILQEQWYSLWTQHTLFLCYFFMPALLGVYCSYLWRLEHLNYNWNAVMTAPVRFIDTYLAKLMTAVSMVILTEA